MSYEFYDDIVNIAVGHTSPSSYCHCHTFRKKMIGENAGAIHLELLFVWFLFMNTCK